MFEPEFLELFTQTVRVWSHTGHNPYGEEEYAPTFTELPTHLKPKSQTVATVAGDVTWVAGTMYIPVTAGLDTSDLFKVQAYDDPEQWVEVDVIRIATIYDEDGPHHQVLYYGEK